MTRIPRLGIFCTLDHHRDLGTTPRQDYRRAIDEAILAERLGLESLWVTEHHFSDYGLVPDPAVLLSAMAQATTHLRLGTATAVLPFDHPLRTAETYALLDQLSGGRLEFGAGSGYLATEFAGFGLSVDDRRTRFDESLAVIRQAWAGGPIRHAGQHFVIDAPALNVRPLQAGGPPVHVAITRPPAAPFVGRQGLALACVPYIALHGPDDLAALIAGYRAALPAGASGGVTIAMHAYCADDAADPGLAAAESALERYLRTRVVPGARYEGGAIARDFVLFGTAGALAARLAALSAIGVDRILLLASFGGLAPNWAQASLGRFARLTE